MKKNLINLICIVLMLLVLGIGYYVVTNTNNISSMSQNNIGTPPEKPNDDNINQDSNSNQSNYSDENVEPPEKKDGMENEEIPNMPSGNMKNTSDINSLKINYIVVLYICVLVFIINLVIFILNKKDKKLTKEQKVIVFLTSIIISCALTFCLIFLLNKYYYPKSQQQKMINQNENQKVTTKGILEVTEELEETGKNYESTEEDVSVIVVDKNGNYTLDSGTITKTGNTSNTESSEFYGLNAALLAKNGGTLTLTNSKITTKAKGSNSVFATNSKSKIIVSDTTINTYNDSSRGLDATYNGEIEAKNMTIHTRGESSATLATDRGEGTVTAVDSNLKTEGKGSPIIYSTGNITLKNSEGVSTNSQAVVVEGKNKATINNTKITTSGIGNRNNVDNAGIMIYQSMSGDAADGRGEFTSINSSIIIDKASNVYKKAPMFFVTNTDAIINLENTNLSYGSNLLLSIKGTNEWGKNSSNGGVVTLNATNQTLKGNIELDNLSEVTINLKESNLTSTINSENTAKKVTLLIDSKSKWEVCEKSYITVLTLDSNNLDLIDDNGYNIYYDKESNEWLDGKTYPLRDGGKLIPV